MQLELSRLREILPVDDAVKEANPQHKQVGKKLKPENVYLGVYHLSSTSTAHRHAALQQSSRALLRASLRLLEDRGIDPRSCADQLKKAVRSDSTLSMRFRV